VKHFCSIQLPLQWHATKTDMTSFNLFYGCSMRASKLMFYCNLSTHFSKGHEQSVLQAASVHISLHSTDHFLFTAVHCYYSNHAASLKFNCCHPHTECTVSYIPTCGKTHFKSKVFSMPCDIILKEMCVEHSRSSHCRRFSLSTDTQ